MGGQHTRQSPQATADRPQSPAGWSTALAFVSEGGSQSSRERPRPPSGRVGLRGRGLLTPRLSVETTGPTASEDHGPRRATPPTRARPVPSPVKPGVAITLRVPRGDLLPPNPSPRSSWKVSKPTGMSRSPERAGGGGRDGRETSGTRTPEGGRRLVLVSSPKTAVRKI